MYKTDLVDARGPACSIWLDLTEYPMPGQSALADLGLSDEQLTFARALVLDGQYPNTYTTLYYLYCSIRVPLYIPKNFAKVISAGYAHQAMDLGVEEAFELSPLPVFDTRAYRTLPPDAVVVSLSRDDPSGERVIVHRSLTAARHLVQYRTRGNAAYPLIKRLAALQRHSDAFLVTNTTTRAMLNLYR
jgi:hypothetical protein